MKVSYHSRQLIHLKNIRMSRIKTPVVTTITGFNHDGRGVARLKGRVQFIWNALPNESVQFRIIRQNKRFTDGIATEINNPHAERIPPRCPHFSTCGGCRLQHASTALQQSHKAHAATELMAQHCPDSSFPTPHWLTHGQHYHYRRKARLSVKYVEKKQAVLVGFREIDGRFIADIHQCDILPVIFSELITPLRNFIHTLKCRSNIPQIECIAADNTHALIIRHLEPMHTEDQLRWRAFAKTHQLQIYLQPGDYQSVHALDDAQPLYYDLPTQNLRLYFQPTQFIQVNAAANHAMIAQALNWLALKPQEKALDLFCGIGNFSLALAQQCEHVIGIEGDDTAIIQARENANHNHIRNATFHTLNLADTQAIDTHLDIHQWQNNCDAILLDPPRCGAAELMPYIIGSSAQKMVYISCNAATLARDTATLISHGFTLKKWALIDMFPHTAHMECIALFTRDRT